MEYSRVQLRRHVGPHRYRQKGAMPRDTAASTTGPMRPQPKQSSKTMQPP